MLVFSTFYARACHWPVDIVYLGETVCSKRRSFTTDDWLEMAETLRDAGKEVVLSTLTLIEAESEIKMPLALSARCFTARSRNPFCESGESMKTTSKHP